MKTFRKKLLGKASAKKPLRKASAKAQSAMEYLMTYGWALLIIAVVLAALFQLGVFNPMTFAPKAPPGSCQVFRPNGPGTTSFINLEGVCSGELPQYVAQFNGQSSYIETSIVPTSNSMLTVTAWVNPLSSNGNRGIVGQGDLGSDYWELKTFGGNYDFVVYGVKDNAFGPVQLNRWSFLTATYNNGVVNLYVNGVQVASYSESATLVQNKNIYIGYTPGDAAPLYFSGSIANVQIYNTSLSSNEIQALYQEGIGGAPIDLQNLVGWWPLNGNANDYSGNGNNGQASNVNFVSNWYNGYTPP